MKKILSLVFIFNLVFVFGVKPAFATNNTAISNLTVYPIVSIGVGNDNTPENTGPVHGNTYNGSISVFATVSDDDADNYHFRVIKDGGIDGYTCTEELALFAPENQGYASTTLNKNACGFVFNQSVYVAPTGFTNSLIATLNTDDLIAHSGEGDYWLILGALDTAGHRSNSNYLNDTRVKITASATPVAVVTPIPTPAPVSNGGGGGGGNGPIVKSYGVQNVGFGSGYVGGDYGADSSNVTANSVTVSNGSTNSGNEAIILADGRITPEDYLNMETEDISTTSEETLATSSNLLAQAISSGFKYNWLWLIILIMGIGGVTYYFYFKKD